MSQRQTLLDKFRIHGGVLTTADFARDPKLSCEYRRLLCELRAEGRTILKSKVKENLWQYRLVESDNEGQLRFA